MRFDRKKKEWKRQRDRGIFQGSRRASIDASPEVSGSWGRGWEPQHLILLQILASRMGPGRGWLSAPFNYGPKSCVLGRSRLTTCPGTADAVCSALFCSGKYPDFPASSCVWTCPPFPRNSLRRVFLCGFPLPPIPPFQLQ